MKKETRRFTFAEEKKHCNKFEEQPAPGQPPIIGALYVQKWFAGAAKEVTLTVELPEAK